ncbi:MAG: DUF2683 family protein [Bacteroidota bacterium]
MEALLVHPKDKEQLKVLKAFMNALNINFESTTSQLPEHVLKSINKGLAQAEKGETISLEDFKKKHFRS